MQLANSSHPITAIAFLRLDKQYLLVGEGQLLKLFDFHTGALVSSQSIFATQSIHGILSSPDTADSGRSRLVLIWGGRSVSILRIFCSVQGGDSSSCSIETLLAEVKASDWVLDACFSPPENALSQRHTFHTVPFLITAHNDLFVLECGGESAPDQESRRLRCWASGPKSLLYSAHLCWKNDKELLVASGAVTGEVIVWSSSTSSQELTSATHRPHLVLKGHEGSVFGVRISGCLNLGERPVWLLCSCSDDRTIRLWEITEVGCSALSDDSKASCVAIVMGHGSRIWSVQFAGGHGKLPDLVSFGEDGTAQPWRLSPEEGDKVAHSDRSCPSMSITHKSTYAYHSGKNLWAHTIISEADDDLVLATGAADSRLVVYNVDTGLDPQSSMKKEISMHEVQSNVDKPDKLQGALSSEVKTPTRAVFEAIQGEWELSRTIKSALPSHPSGKLEGTAKLESRHVTDAEYDAEMVYHEQGEFTSNNIPGLKMNAKRSYVYRYQKTTDAISVWFVKLDGISVDYLFHILDFSNISSLDLHSQQVSAKRLKATGHHLCEKDTYDPEYDFHFADTAIMLWSIKYSVKGPQKDYVSVANYKMRQPGKQGKIESSSPVAQENESQKKTSASASDFFKAYGWITSTELLATTAQGNVFLGTLNKSQHDSILEEQFKPNEYQSDYSVLWEPVGSSIDLTSTFSISTDTTPGLALLTGNNASIYLYQHSSKKMSKLDEDDSKDSRKIGYVKIQTSLKPIGAKAKQQPKIKFLLRSLGSHHAELYGLAPDAPPAVKSMFQLPRIDQEVPDEFVTTSSWISDTDDLVIEGSRQGALRIHSLLHSVTRLVEGIHGGETITAILPLAAHDLGKFYHILTAGRDGKYAYHEIRINEDKSIDFQTIHIARTSFGPNIEGAYIEPETLDIVIWGFSSTRFVVWNETEQSEMMSVECGGAHRHWSYFHHGDTGSGSFAWTKASSCNVYYQPRPSHRVLQLGGHGREIKAMAISPLLEHGHAGGGAKRLIATGAEDTTIRLFQFQADTLKCLHIMREHTTGVQKLLWSPDGRWLFSAGGCEEFFAWRVRKLNKLICVVCVARCPRVTEEKDLRITDFTLIKAPSSKVSGDSCQDYTISTVYSDSSIRIWNFNAENEDFAPPNPDRFTLQYSGTYGTNCLTQIQTLNSSHSSKILCTASSDGHLALWHSPTPPDPESNNLSPSHRQLIHQSSIASILTIPLHSNVADTTQPPSTETTAISEPPPNSPPLRTTIIITGSDDQSLALTLFTQTPPPPSLSPPPQAHPPPSAPAATILPPQLLIPNAHASAITSLAYLGHDQRIDNSHETDLRFASVGNDQRLKTWIVTVRTNTDSCDGSVAASNVRIRKVGDVYTGVADASSLDSYREEDGGTGGEGGDQEKWNLIVAGIGMESWKVDGLDGSR